MSETEAAMKFGETLGYIVWPIAFVVLGYVVARAINKKREFDNQVKWPIVTGFALAGLMVLSYCAPKPGQAPAMSELERQKRAAGDVVGNISFSRTVQSGAELVDLPLSDEALATIDRQAGALLSAEFPKRGIDIEGPLSSVSENLTLRGKKLYQSKIRGALKHGQGPVYMLIVTGPVGDGVGALTCAALDGQSFELSGSPCGDEALKFFELSGTKS